MQFQISCSGYANYHDDLSATMQLFQNEHMREDNFAKASTFLKPFLSDIHRVISVNVDFSGDTKTELYLRNGLHQRMLSMQLSLGYRGEQQHRSLSSKVAFAILQLRWATLTFAMGLKTNPPGIALPADAELKRTGKRTLKTMTNACLTSTRNRPLLPGRYFLDTVIDELRCR